MPTSNSDTPETAAPPASPPMAGGVRTWGRSRFRGVSWHSQTGTWRAQIQAKGKHQYLGCFDDDEAAARAYDKAAREIHGAYARLNFPDTGPAPSGGTPAMPPGTIGRYEAMARFGVGLKTWQRWEQEGVIRCGKMFWLPSGGRLKVYPVKEIERLVEEYGRFTQPYPDPDRPGCYRVPLTGFGINRREAIIDAESLSIVEGRRWCWSEGTTEGKGMVVQARLREAVPLRRIIMGVVERPAEEVLVAHINGDPLDCRRENLVLRTITQRLASARKRKTHNGKPCSSQYKGVSWIPHRSKWKATIKAEGKVRHLGLFHDEAVAAEAYDEAARKYFGEHAWLNFPDGESCDPSYALRAGEAARRAAA